MTTREEVVRALALGDATDQEIADALEAALRKAHTCESGALASTARQAFIAKLREADRADR